MDHLQVNSFRLGALFGLNLSEASIEYVNLVSLLVNLLLQLHIVPRLRRLIDIVLVFGDVSDNFLEYLFFLTLNIHHKRLMLLDNLMPCIIKVVSHFSEVLQEYSLFSAPTIQSKVFFENLAQVLPESDQIIWLLLLSLVGLRRRLVHPIQSLLLLGRGRV